jgi:hypothetical protein
MGWGRGSVCDFVLFPCLVYRNAEGYLNVGELGVVVVPEVGHSGELKILGLVIVGAL